MDHSKPETGEELVSSLGALYSRYGYSHYKMNKFEEYDLYAHHKDFLISDRVLTFTDGSGKLLALKPDVTLSIVKNTTDLPQGAQKLYYTENVYRAARESRNFKEIMQVGLECLGKVDDYSLYEVLHLALQSLHQIGGACVLSVSHLGIINEVMESAGIPADRKAAVLKLLENRNLHELSALLAALGTPPEKAEVLKALIRIGGSVGTVLPELKNLLVGACRPETRNRFLGILSAFSDETALQIDFSVVGDIHYYNGFIFKGFCKGLPSPVLSGGQYDTLMRKMGRKASAIGFAVYLDVIAQYRQVEAQYDVDNLLLYRAGSSPADIHRAAQALIRQGQSVLAEPEIPAGVRYQHCLILENGEVKRDENHA